jgi:hypothetical protein
LLSSLGRASTAATKQPNNLQFLLLLLLSSGVTHVAVKPWKDANGCYRLAGYVAPDSVDLAAAEKHCRAKLLPAMVSASTRC